MKYTREGIMAQIWIAFGQGAGALRVSQEAALELHRWYHDAITPDIVRERWRTDAVQVLERMRAIGRLAALKATLVGATAIAVEHVYESAAAVQAQSSTPLCPPQPSQLEERGWPHVEAVAAGATRAAAGRGEADAGAGRVLLDLRARRGA